MARLKSNILDAGSGKVGSVIMYERNGTSCIRSLPDFYKDRKSEAQLRQRQKMKLIHDLLRPFIPLLKLSFFEANTGRSAYQSAQSYHLKNAIAGQYPEQYVDFSKVLLTRGRIHLPENIDLSLSENKAVLTWSTKSTPSNASWDDTLIMIWRDKQGDADFVLSGVRRHSCQFEYVFYNGVRIDELDIWIAFRNAEETDWSNSMLLT